MVCVKSTVWNLVCLIMSLSSHLGKTLALCFLCFETMTPLLSSIQCYYYEICWFFEVMVSYFFPEDFRIFCITDFLNITLTCLSVEIFVSILFRFSYLLFEFGKLEGNIFLYISPHSPYMLVNSFLLGLLLNTYGHFNVCLYFLMFPSFFLSLNPFLMQVLRLPQAYLTTFNMLFSPHILLFNPSIMLFQ